MVTRSMKAALLWLKNRNGTGVFERNGHTLVAAGERAPIMRATWLRLMEKGWIETLERRRVTVTEKGNAIRLDGIEESSGSEFLEACADNEREEAWPDR